MAALSVSLGFEPPAKVERERAIGDLHNLPLVLQRAFSSGDEFLPISKPGPIDWLAIHNEPGQLFQEFVRSKPNKPAPPRTKLYFQPLGEFPQQTAPSLDKLKGFAEAFFQMPAEVLPPARAKDQFTRRRNPTTPNPQILTTDVLDFLKGRLPADGFCLLAITMEDLYPEESWNFVFGQASLRERVGVYSFARYDPAFFHEARGTDYQKLILRRSAAVLAHETGHMFGIQHCIYFQCLMNGSNHLRESDSRPLHLCPVCLRKLHHSVGFDVTKRYRQLDGWLTEMKLNEEAAWTQKMLQKLEGQYQDGARK